MRYIVKVVNLSPEGEPIDIQYWIAENESEMEAMLRLKIAHTSVVCLSPETKLGYTLINKVKEIQQAAPVDLAIKTPSN